MKKLASIPLLALLAGIIAGILGQRYAPGWIFPSAALLLSGAAIIARRLSAASVALATVIGWLAGELVEPYIFSSIPDSETVYSGIVAESQLGADKQTLHIRADRLIAGNQSFAVRPFLVRATLPFFDPHIEAGDKVVFKGTYSPPRIDTDLPLESDLSSAYYNQGVSLIAYIPLNHIKITGRSSNPLYALARLRESVAGAIYASGLNEPTADFIAAIIAGDAAGIDNHRRSLYASAGVAHILALSGAHVAVIVLILSIAMQPVAIFAGRRARWWLVIAGIWLFALTTGASASVVRSSVMASVVILAIIFDKPRSSLNSLCLAAMAILLCSPHSLYRAGFQFSFLATLSIILLSDRLNPFACRSRASHMIAGLFTVTIAATIGTMPLMAYHFHQIPAYFLIANLAAAVVMPLMMTAAAAMLLFSLFGPAPDWLITAMNFIGGKFESLIEFVSTLPHSNVDGIYFPAWLLIPIYLFIASLLLSLMQRQKWLMGAAACFGLISVIAYVSTRPSYPAEELFIVRDKHSFNMLIRRGSLLKVLSTDSPLNREADSTEIVRRYGDYLATSHVAGIDFHFGRFITSGQTDSLGRISFNGATFRFAGKDEHSTSPLPSTYCIADRRFRGDIVALGRGCGADTLLLTADMNALRRRRYLLELKAADIPCRDIAASPFSLSSSN